MEIIRENLNIDVNSFMNALKSIEGINEKAYNSQDKSLKLDVIEGWTKTSELDNLIIEFDLDNFAFVVSPNVENFDSSEIQKKIRKNALLKNKLITINYNYSTKELSFKFAKPFGQPETDALDGIVDNLVGYDVITQLMTSYVQKSSDGVVYYNKKRSELVESIKQGVRTSAEAFEIDVKIKNVKDSLLTGDWITAQTYLSMTTVEGAYTQEIKDEFASEIQEYITNNY
jgi:hypothetical protein